HAFQAEARRGGPNATFAVTFPEGGNWEALGAAEGRLAALDGTGTDIENDGWPADLRLVLGEEGRGLPPGLTAEKLAIRTTGAVESLNATVAASLALHAHFRRRLG